MAEADRLLSRALERSQDAALRGLVRLRLAELRLAEDKPDAALTLADAVAGASWRALREEIRGDALARLGRADEARRAYDDALAALDEGSQARTFLEMKRGDLVAAATAAPTLPSTPAVPAADGGDAKAEAAEPDAGTEQGS